MYSNHIVDCDTLFSILYLYGELKTMSQSTIWFGPLIAPTWVCVVIVICFLGVIEQEITLLTVTITEASVYQVSHFNLKYTQTSRRGRNEYAPT